MSLNRAISDAIYAKLYGAIAAGNTGSGDLSSEPVHLCFVSPVVPFDDLLLDFETLDTAEKYEAAAAFAELTNILPPALGFWRPDAPHLWDVYARVLDEVVLAESVLTASEAATLRAARSLLWTDVPVVENGMTYTAPVPTPLYRQYLEYQDQYAHAQLAYSAGLLTAMNAPNDPEVAADWAIRGPALATEAQLAEARWKSAGRDKVEGALARIERLSARDPYQTWHGLEAQFRDNRRTDPADSEYLRTLPGPRGAVPAAAPWAAFTVFGSELDHIDTSSRALWGGEETATGIFLPPLKSGKSSHELLSLTTTRFVLRCEIRRVPITRPWFSPEVFRNRAWRWRSSSDAPLSDGKVPPSGDLVAYPSEILLARKLTLRLEETSVVADIDWTDIQWDRSDQITSGGIGNGSVLEEFRKRFNLPPRPGIDPGTPVLRRTTVLKSLPFGDMGNAVGDWKGAGAKLKLPTSFPTGTLGSFGSFGSLGGIGGAKGGGFHGMKLNVLEAPSAGSFTAASNASGDAAQQLSNHETSKDGDAGTMEVLDIAIPGVHLLGFICKPVPRSPNPDPAFAWPK